MTTKLRLRRIELELNQAELAEILGVGQPSVCQWETGKNKPRGFPMKRKLEALLGLPLHVLLESENGTAIDDAVIQSGSATKDRYVTG